MQPDISREAAPPVGGIDRLSLQCAAALLVGLIAFALLITVAKPALSTLLFGDVSAYVALILVLAVAIWGITWFYMARLGRADAAGRE